jgi:ketosteroid isomerase-like protein
MKTVKYITGLLLLLAAMVAGCSSFVTSTGKDAMEKDKILALERGALDKWKNGDVTGFIAIAADDISYFDPSLTSKLDGKAAFEKHLMAANGTFTIPRYEMINPQVRLEGNLAVLHFNFQSVDANNAPTSRWNSTEVYVHRDGRWQLWHSHWSLAKKPK